MLNELFEGIKHGESIPLSSITRSVGVMGLIDDTSHDPIVRRVSLHDVRKKHGMGMMLATAFTMNATFALFGGAELLEMPLTKELPDGRLHVIYACRCMMHLVCIDLTNIEASEANMGMCREWQQARS